MSQKKYVIAHKGVADHALENTLGSFSAAIDAGADMIEFDVRKIRTGEMIAFHDSHLNGVALSQLDRRQITDATGTEPALFADILQLCIGRIMLDIELKEDGYVGEVIAGIKAASAEDQVIVTSFLPGTIAQIKDFVPSIKTGLLVGGGSPETYLRGRMRDLYPVELAQSISADYIAPHYTLAKLGVLKRASAAGFPCLVWTVNTENEIRRLAADPRVAGIITDKTALARSIVG
jgi:glycerophosphoryl diester phosphodiesterase